MIRGTKFDRDAERDLAAFLKNKSPEAVRQCFRRLGAEEIQARADFCAVIPFLPNYPILVNIWFADEEFPASGKMLLEGNADHYLTVEDAVTGRNPGTGAAAAGGGTERNLKKCDKTCDAFGRF